MAVYGEAWVDLHVNSDKIEPETDRALHKMGRDTQDTMNDVGHSWGKEASKGIGDEIEKSGPNFARHLENSLRGRKVRTKVTYQLDRDQNIARTWVSHVIQDIEDAAADASGPGGPLDKVGKGFADAIGAGFNVSGRSSLIFFLVPLVGVIGALIGAALQAINALAAALATLPALLTAIGLQVGVLMLAFKGVGTAIGGAFAAKNAKELQEAIKGLTQPAQEFVKALLPLKRFFQDLQMVAQANFFHFFGADVIPRIFKSIGPTVLQGFITLGRVLGETFRDMALFFASPSFREFLQKVIPSTVKFLQSFGPSFTTFLKGLIDLATASLPFLQSLGQMLGGTLTQLGVFFSDAARDPATLKWFHDMQETMEDLLELFGSATDFVFSFLKSLNDTGAGQDLIQTLSDAFEQLAFFFASPVGREAIKGLADALIILTFIFVGLAESISAGLVLIEALWQFFQFIGMHAKDIGAAILIGFAVIGSAVVAFLTYIWHGLLDFFRLIYETIKADIQLVITVLEKLPEWFRSLGTRIYRFIKDFFKDAGEWLYREGRNLVRGLADGMLSALGFLTNAGKAVGSAAANAVSNYMPGSPAKEGPLSGSGYVKLRGERMMQDFAEGIQMATPDLEAASLNAVSNISFGRDSINVRYEGVSPTEQQARTTGSAVGSGILDRLAARNTRLAVRTL